MKGVVRMDERFQQQLRFLIESDKMKNILRQTLISDGSRRENDAEHSWHFALAAMILYEYAGQDGVDLLRVMKMAIIHDLIEIYAGDTFAFDPAGNESKLERETEAAGRLFGILPPDQGAELRALWEEFDAMETPDAQFAAALDRIQAFINNSVTGWHTWKLGKVTNEQVHKRMEMVRIGMPALWEFVEENILGAIRDGILRE